MLVCFQASGVLTECLVKNFASINKQKNHVRKIYLIVDVRTFRLK